MQYANSDLTKTPAAEPNANNGYDEAMNVERVNGQAMLTQQPSMLARNPQERRATAKLDYYKKLAELQQMNLEFGRNIREAQHQTRQTHEANGKLSGHLNNKSTGENGAHPLTAAFHVATQSNGQSNGKSHASSANGSARPALAAIELPTLTKPLPQNERVTASLDFNRLMELQRHFDEAQGRLPQAETLPAHYANENGNGNKAVSKALPSATQVVQLSIEDRLAVNLLEAHAPRLPLRESAVNEERKLTPVQPQASPEAQARRSMSDLERRVTSNPAAHYSLETAQSLQQRQKTDAVTMRPVQSPAHSFDRQSERVREALLDPTRIDPHLISLSDLNPRAAKYYDQVAVSLIAISYKRLLKRVLITSALHGEGRTSVALNLAGALARARQRVLVVDCDLLNPSVLRLLGLDAPVGLSEAVRRGLSPNAATLRVQPAAFNLLPMREKVSHSAELLASPRFHELIQMCEADYDFLLFDSSPLLESPDANLLAGLTDATLMVIRPGYSTTQQMAKAVSLFNEKDICGVVLNRVGE